MLQTEQKPNIKRAQNRVNSFIPALIFLSLYNCKTAKKCYISFFHNIQNARTAKNPSRSKQARSANRDYFVRIFTFQFKVREADETEDGPEQGLGRLEKIAETSPDEAGRVSGLLLA